MCFSVHHFQMSSPSQSGNTNINLLSARVDQSAAPTTSHAPSPHTRTVQRHTHGIDSVVRHKQLSAAGYPLPINQSRRGGLRSFNDHGEVGGHGGRRRSVGGPRGTEHGELCTHQSTLVETKLLISQGDQWLLICTCIRCIRLLCITVYSWKWPI